MRSHAPQTLIRSLMTGAMGWLMACSVGPAPQPGATVAQTSQADTSACMSDGDCPNHYFCDFTLVDDPTYGGICSPSGGVPCSSDVCKTFELGPIASGGGGLSCASCDCTSDSGSFSGDVCGYSTDELVQACSSSC